MKICPFISHLVGEDDINTLTAESTPNQKKSASQKGSKKEDKNVVILGYDDESWNGVQTKTVSKTSTKETVFPHLSCLKESCRFFKKNTGECIFDRIFDLLNDQKKTTDIPTEKQVLNEGRIKKELEKVWKLQTKSTAEMITSISENEKNQQEFLENFKTELRDFIESMLVREENTEDHAVEEYLQPLKDDIGKLSNAMSEREDVLDSFSTILSETVVSIEDNIDKLGEKIIRVTDEIEQLKKTGEERSPCQNELNEKVELMMDQMSKWEERFSSLQEHQSELIDFFEKDIERHHAAEERDKRKEAKKHNNLGVTSFHNGAFEMAKEQFLHAVELDEKFAEAFNNLGLTCTELGEEEDATEAFKKAIQLNPGLAAAYTNLGYVFYKQGSYEQAIEMYNESLGRSSDNSSAYTNLGNAYFKLNKITEARESWKKSIEIDPGNERAKRYLERIKDKK